MAVQCFITPKEPLYQRQIFALGIDYCPQPQQQMIAKARAEVDKILAKLPGEKREDVKKVFHSIMQHLELFLEAIQQASQGKDPRQHSIHWHTLMEDLHGIHSLIPLKEHAPKTYQYLKQIEEKYTAFLGIFIRSINLSTLHYFSTPAPLPESNFKLDKIAETFSEKKYQVIPLAQAILKLQQLLELYLQVFRNFYNDHYLKDYPKLWPVRKANVSIGGVALNIPQTYPKFSRVNVRLYFEKGDTLLEFEGSIVKSEKQEEGVYTAINFELPDGAMQDELQQQIYQSEIEATLGIRLPY